MSSACVAHSRSAIEHDSLYNYTTTSDSPIVLHLTPAFAQERADQARRSATLYQLHSSTATYLHYHQDYPYLSPIIKEIEQERKERLDMDAMVITKPNNKA